MTTTRLSRRRCVVGRDVVVIEQSEREVYIEGRVRLRPGGYIELCDEGTRVAYVSTWMVARLGRDGPVYRGICRWVTPDG